MLHVRLVKNESHTRRLSQKSEERRGRYYRKELVASGESILPSQSLDLVSTKILITYLWYLDQGHRERFSQIDYTKHSRGPTNERVGFDLTCFSKTQLEVGAPDLCRVFRV